MGAGRASGGRVRHWLGRARGRACVNCARWPGVAGDTRMRLQTYPDRDMLAIDLANRMAGELAAALMNQDRATLIVPGGSTPGPVFDALCAADIDWERV